MKRDRYVLAPSRQPTEWCMDVQLLPHLEGDRPSAPDKLMKNSMVEEGAPEGDGWIALLSSGILLVGVGAMALIFR